MNGAAPAVDWLGPEQVKIEKHYWPTPPKAAVR